VIGVIQHAQGRPAGNRCDRRRRDRLLQLGRHVPAVTIVIDTPERIAGAYSIIDEFTSERGLATCETISCLDEAGRLAQARK
jgi:PII-like signaling protein